MEQDNPLMSSPSSPGYLPQYLLGGSSPAASPFLRGRSTVGSYGSYRGSSSTGNTVSSPQSYSHQFVTPLQKSKGMANKRDRTPFRISPAVGCIPNDSLSAPPVEGLYDLRVADFSHYQLSKDQPIDVNMDSEGNITSPVNTIQFGRNITQHSNSQCSSPFPSPTQIDPFYTQGTAISSDDVLDECWVTVFGFPPEASSYILKQFSQYGSIVRSKTSKGNWLHIQYQSKLQAKKALSKHGKVYGTDIMVGVVPCIDKSVMDSCGKENIPSPTSRDESLAASVTGNRPSPIRALTAAYQAACSDHQVCTVPLLTTPMHEHFLRNHSAAMQRAESELMVIPDAGRTPQKDTNIVSKAMEYLLGW